MIDGAKADEMNMTRTSLSSNLISLSESELEIWLEKGGGLKKRVIVPAQDVVMASILTSCRLQTATVRVL